MNGKLSIPDRPTIEPRWLFPLLDACLVLAAFLLAYSIRYDWQILRPILDPRQVGFSPYVPFALVYAVLLYFSYYQNGLYRNVRGRTWSEEISIITSGVATSTVILLAMYFLLRPEVTSRLMLIYVAALTVALQSGLRLMRRMVLAYLRMQGIGLQRVLIIGMGETGQAVMRVMVSRRELDYKVVGYVRDASDESDFQPGQVRDLMPVASLQSGLQRLRPDLVVHPGEQLWGHVLVTAHREGSFRPFGHRDRVDRVAAMGRQRRWPLSQRTAFGSHAGTLPARRCPGAGGG